MTVTAPPPVVPAGVDAEALFREARRRRRRRWSAVILLIVTALVAVPLLANESVPRRPRPQPHVGLRRWVPPPGAGRSAPAVFVDGNGKGGVGVYSTATGSLLRTLSPQAPGGPDQQAVLSSDRQSVYFVEPSGACGGTILRAPVSGASPPTAVISVPQTLALEPAASPRGSDLAWVGVTCGPSGSVATSRLYVTDVKTETTIALGTVASSNDNGIAWSRDGRLLAVETGETIDVMSARQASLRQGNAMQVTSGCRLTSPVFLSRPNELAVIRTCSGKSGETGTSAALVFNTETGKPVSFIASAQRGSMFQGLSVDESGGRILLGVVGSFPASATNVQVESGRLVTVSQHSPTDAEW